jgi:alanine dehydrogenase
MHANLAVVPEDIVASLIGPDEALEAVRSTFIAMARGVAKPFPVIREFLGESGPIFGVKSGVDRAAETLGLKAGGYWASNLARGLTNHQSAVLLFDVETGRPSGLVGGNRLTAMRTAAAAALSIDLLARKDVRALGILGAGAQAQGHLRAALAVRAFSEIVVWNRTRERASDLAATIAPLASVRVAETPKELAESSDVIITITAATAPILNDEWVKPGTHLACMGADTMGKQEVAAELVACADVYVDAIEQSVSIGECQAAVRAGLLTPEEVRGSLGELMIGQAKKRRSQRAITLFDGTGVALQDLAVATLVIERARSTGKAQIVSF